MTDNREPNDEALEPEEEQSGPAVTMPSGDNDDRVVDDAVGAYLLDALEDDERAAFERHLASSPEAQAELRELAPVVALLPKLFELDEAPAEGAAPTPELRDRIVDAAVAGAATADDHPDEAMDGGRPRTIRTAPQSTGPFEPKRRAVRPPERRAPRPAPNPLAGLSRFPTSWLAAAGLAIVAIGAIIWALALQGRIDSKNREIAAQSERLTTQEEEIAELRDQANATSFTLSATGEQAAGASGTLLYSLQENIGVLYVRDLPPLDDETAYQLWYLDDETAAPRPGGTFQVDRNGSGFIIVESDTPGFDGLAVSVEPEAGSESPTGPVLLQGRLGGARG